jgi:hypothetical protein
MLNSQLCSIAEGRRDRRQSKGEAAFKIYRAWLQDCRNEWNKKVIAHAEQITPRQWIVKIRSTKVDGEYIYPPDAGTTDPGYWHKDPGTGEYTLRAKGWRSCSLDLTTYLFTSQESYSHLHDLDSESSTSSREGAALPINTQEPNCLDCWEYTPAHRGTHIDVMCCKNKGCKKVTVWLCHEFLPDKFGLFKLSCNPPHTDGEFRIWLFRNVFCIR